MQVLLGNEAGAVRCTDLGRQSLGRGSRPYCTTMIWPMRGELAAAAVAHHSIVHGGARCSYRL